MGDWGTVSSDSLSKREKAPLLELSGGIGESRLEIKRQVIGFCCSYTEWVWPDLPITHGEKWKVQKGRGTYQIGSREEGKGSRLADPDLETKVKGCDCVIK